MATAEQFLSANDPKLSEIISCQSARWPFQATEDPIWGLVRIVMAQQISTRVACRLAEHVMVAYPKIDSGSCESIPDVSSLRRLGIPERRALCCVSLLQRSDEIRERVKGGQTWQEVVADFKGIGPWTIDVFRIMVLRHPDVLPTGDVGLKRAVERVYGDCQNMDHLSERWRPFRSVACWYLWRTLGNEQLG